MATPTQALAKHFSDNWTYTAISWANFNGFFDAGKTRTGFTNNDLWVEPKIEFVDSSGQMENPTAFAKTVHSYLFSIWLVGTRDSGTANFSTRAANLVSLYNRTSVTSESVTMYFRELQTFDGFVRDVGGNTTSEGGSYWAVPSMVAFGVSV